MKKTLTLSVPKICLILLVWLLSACTALVASPDPMLTATPVPPTSLPPSPLPPTATTAPSATVTLTIAPSATATRTKTLPPTQTPTPAEGQLISIGVSAGGRPLEVAAFGHGSVQRMVIAGIHGGYESNTIALADEIIAELRKNPGLVPQRVTLYILRALNPDGAARAVGADGRANEHGVDLNRNWDVNWQAEWNRAGCWNLSPISGGTAPHSEPEVVALQQFIQQHSLDALISYHSAGLGIFAGGQPAQARSKSLARALARVSTYSYPPRDGGCQLTGQLIDWAAARGIAAVDVELSDHTDTEFLMNLTLLETFLTWQP
jgi:hypothetical protein